MRPGPSFSRKSLGATQLLLAGLLFGPILMGGSARAAEDAGFYGDSVVAYDEYLQISPKDDSVRRDRARVLGYTGARLAEGIRELAVYVQRHPKDSIGYYYLGQLTWRANTPEEALEQDNSGAKSHKH